VLVEVDVLSELLELLELGDVLVLVLVDSELDELLDETDSELDELELLKLDELSDTLVLVDVDSELLELLELGDADVLVEIDSELDELELLKLDELAPVPGMAVMLNQVPFPDKAVYTPVAGLIVPKLPEPEPPSCAAMYQTPSRY